MPKRYLEIEIGDLKKMHSVVGQYDPRCRFAGFLSSWSQHPVLDSQAGNTAELALVLANYDEPRR